MKKIILLLIFLINIGVVYSYNYPVLHNQTMDNTTFNGNWTLNSSGSQGCTINRLNSGIANCTSDNSKPLLLKFVHRLVNISTSSSNWTMEFDMGIGSTTSTPLEFFSLADINTTGVISNANQRTGFRLDGAGSFDIVSPDGIIVRIGNADGSIHHYKVQTLSNRSWNYYKDGVEVFNVPFSTLTGNTSFISFFDSNNALIQNFTLDNFLVYNGTYLSNPISLTSNLQNNQTVHYLYRNVSINVNFSMDVDSSTNTIVKINLSTPEGFNAQYLNINSTSFFLNQSFNASSLSIGKHNITVGYCSESLCNTTTYQYYLFNYTAEFQPNVIQTESQIFKLIIDFANISLRANGTIVYNDIPYNTQNSSSRNQENLTATIQINQPNSANFYWEFKLNQSNFITSNFSQTVTSISIANCTSLTQVSILNISIFNENVPTQYLEGSIDAIFTTWTNNSQNTINFSLSFNDNTNYSVCIFPNTSINSNVYLQYNTTNGFRERYYLTNARFTTNTSLLYLYNFNNQSGISELRGTVRSPEFDYFPNIVTKLQRFYPSENVWRTVQVDRSDEFGLVLFYVIEKTVDYRLIFEQNGNQIDKTDNNLKFTCIDGICSVNFQLDDTNTITSQDLIIQTGYDNRSQIYEVNFSDSTALTSSVRLRVTQYTGVSQRDICDTTLASSSGTLRCNTSGYSGTLTVRIYDSASPEVIFKTEYITKVLDALFKKSGMSTEAAFWSVGISSTLTIAGFTIHPILGILLYVISLIGVLFMGLLNYVTIGFITLVGVGAGITIYLLRRD